jgi:HEAT repeat protein
MLVLLALPLCLWQLEAQTLQIMFRGYFTAERDVTRLEMMQELITYEGPEMSEFLADALADVTTFGEPRFDAREATARAELKRIIVTEIGRRRVTGTADMLYKLYVEEPDPLLRGLALESLGSIGAREYAPNIADILDKLNDSPTRRGGDESIALGAIAALEALQEPVGYAPVFFASVGRYSARTSKRAREALPKIVDDPTEVIAGIIDENPDANLRRLAIEAHAVSGAPEDSKIDIAVRTLAESLAEAKRNRVTMAAHDRLQTSALETLVRFGASSEPSLPLLDEMGRDSNDVNVRVLAIRALGVNGTDAAARLLAAQLSVLNDQQERGGGVDNRLVRALIAALGENGSEEGGEELTRVKFIGYASGIVRAAEEALARLGD